MPPRSSALVRRPAAAGALLILAQLFLALQATAGAPNDWPLDVAADYKVTFSGINIGRFRFASKIEGDGYKLNGNTKLSVLLGAYKYKGTLRSTGTMDGDGPRPAEHRFEFTSTNKEGSVTMRFGPQGVASYAVEPKKDPSRSAVPLKPYHLLGVLDPLSAITAMSRAGNGPPCERKVKIFDGKNRFDLALSPRGETEIKDPQPSGQPAHGYVCKVRYVPIAGHKDNANTKALADGDIEIVFRPVPEANLLVPHRIIMSTGWGPVALTAERVQITTAERKQIALGGN